MSDYTQLIDSLVQLDGESVVTQINVFLESGVAPDDILNQGLIAGMDIIGDKMESGDMFIPEVLMAAQIMSRGLDILKPLLGDESQSAKGVVIIGTVKGDLHDIGKNLVAMMMESSGLTVHNLGVDIDPDEFIRQVREKNANILCLSALLTTTMLMIKQTIDAVIESGLRDKVKIMVGGAPVTQNFSEEIGADAFAPDAGSAAKSAKALIA